MAKIANKTYDAEGRKVSIEFVDGKKVSIDIGNLPEAVRERALAHGIMQKLGDSYAGALSVADAFASCEQVATNLEQGVWNAGRATGTAKGGILVEALARATGRTVEEAAKVLADMPDDKQKELRKHPEVRAAEAHIRAERAAAKVGEGSTLGDLFGTGKPKGKTDKA